MKVVFDTHGNDKQKEVARHWLNPSVSDIVYGGSKGCFVAGTLVMTRQGHRPIESLNPGDFVLSTSRSGFEFKEVQERFTYGGNIQREMITFTLGSHTIKCTDNHEFYFKGHWVAAGELARRIMALRAKHGKPVLYLNFRPFDDDGIQGEQSSHDHEACNESGRIHEDHDKVQRKASNDLSSPDGLLGIPSESGEPSTNQSHRLQPSQQSGRQFGVVHCEAQSRALETPEARRLCEGGSTSEFLPRIEGLEREAKRIAGRGNQEEIQAVRLHTSDACGRLRGVSGYDKGHNPSDLAAREIKADEITMIEFSIEPVTVYDLCVADNHNYTVTTENIIVHNSGKSYLGCSLIFGNALMYPGTHYFVARKTLKDIRNFTIPSIHEVFQHWNLDDKYFRFNANDNFFKLHNGSFVFLIEAAYRPTDPTYQRFGSMQMTRGWIEEAGEFETSAMTNLAASIGRWKNDVYDLPGKLLQTCNPSKNYLYRNYYKPHVEQRLDEWKRFVQALPTDNKKLPAGYLENLNRVLTTNEKERLLKGNWEYDDDPATMCDYTNILDIFTNAHVSEGPGYISADVARMGKDTTIIRVWSGWRCIKRVVMVKARVDEVSARIRELANSYQIPMSRVIADEDGVGGGVVDILRCVGFVAASTPLLTFEKDQQGQTVKANFDMLKSQCAFKLADVINAAGLYDPQEGEIRDRVTLELEQLKRKAVDSDMKQGIVKKDDMKEMLGHSPDDLDTYIMRAYFDVLLSTVPTSAPTMMVY